MSRPNAPQGEPFKGLTDPGFAPVTGTNPGTPASSLDGYGQPVGASDTATIAIPTEGYAAPMGESGVPQQQPSTPGSPPTTKPRHSRAGAAWVALIVAAVIFIFLLVFIMQNSGPVQIKYFGFEGTMSLGVAMMFAAVLGALTAGLLGTVRILQLRTRAKRARTGR